jgi:hypothetical protein
VSFVRFRAPQNQVLVLNWDEISRRLSRLNIWFIIVMKELKLICRLIYLKELSQDYSSLSKLFSEMEGGTIEHYFIAQKIEKQKSCLFMMN